MQNLSDTLTVQNTPTALVDVIVTVTDCCKLIGSKLRGGAFNGAYGNERTENVQGEVQKKLDILANNILKQALLDNPNVAGIASEEENDIVAGTTGGKYLITFDPLDGSSNIDVNVSVGTIFSILPAPSHTVSEADFLQSGRAQVAAGYVLFGPATTLVLTTGNGVNVYALHDDGQYYVTETQKQVASSTQEFAINMSNQRFWQPAMQHYVSDLLLGEEGPLGKRFNMRWVASMVAEVHRIITRGGIFMYPWDNREPAKPGKLRLMYEGNPMSFLMEQAGGTAHDCAQPIMDIIPSHIHQRVPVIMGCHTECNQVLQYHQR